MNLGLQPGCCNTPIAFPDWSNKTFACTVIKKYPELICCQDRNFPLCCSDTPTDKTSSCCSKYTKEVDVACAILGVEQNLDVGCCLSIVPPPNFCGNFTTP